MRAGGSVEAILGDKKTLDRFTVHDVRFDDFVDIRGGDPAVPNGVWINDHSRAVLTLIQAS